MLQCKTWKPAQVAAGAEPLRRIYDLRHTFAAFALRAGISTFDLCRYMGASLTMIDRHYGPPRQQRMPAQDLTRGYGTPIRRPGRSGQSSSRLPSRTSFLGSEPSCELTRNRFAF